MVELWSRDDYLTGGEWPYNLYQYDGSEYALIAEVNMWSCAADTVNYQGEPYPEDIDAEGAGVVYILTRNGITETVSKSEYGSTPPRKQSARNLPFYQETVLIHVEIIWERSQITFSENTVTGRG